MRNNEKTILISIIIFLVGLMIGSLLGAISLAFILTNSISNFVESNGFEFNAYLNSTEVSNALKEIISETEENTIKIKNPYYDPK